MGEDLVPANLNGGRPQQTTASATATGGKQYKVEPGENLARIAAKTLGSASKANIAAIIAANPSLQQNPNKIIVGRTYNIPGGGTAVADRGDVVHARARRDRSIAFAIVRRRIVLHRQAQR